MNNKTLRTFFILLLSAFLLSGCASPFKRGEALTTSNTLWETNDFQYVKVVQRVDNIAGNQHPNAISPADMRTILNALYASERVGLKRQQNPLFTIGEQQILSNTLSKALSQAQPNEDVAFVSIGTHPSLLGKEPKSTSGRMFIEGGKLNIIFGLLHDPYSKRSKETGQEIDRRSNPLLPGSRGKVSNTAERLALDSGQALFIDPATGKERRDWLVIDIPTLLASTQSQASALANGSLSPEIRESIARNSQTVSNLKQDVAELKEIVFELQSEVRALRGYR